MDETVKVIDVTGTETKDEGYKEPKKSLPYNKIAELTALVLPKSPYLQKMHCAFRDVAKLNNSRNETINLKDEKD